MNANYCYYAALTGYFGLFFLIIIWNTLLAPASKFPVALQLLLTMTPLLLPLRGFLNANLKSCAWAAYVSLIYFTHGTVEAVTSPVPVRYYAALEIIFSLLLFLGCTLYIRLAARH
jgi:uncharacterized membrane protein